MMFQRHRFLIYNLCMKSSPLRLQDFVFLAVFLSALLSGAQMLGIDSDLGRHLTLGNYILDHRVIPTSDLFSHTLTGASRPPYEWMTQVLLAIANRLLGLDGVILLTAALIAVTFSLLYDDSLRRSQSPLISLTVTLLAVAASSIHWLPRPHIITFLFIAIWLSKLEQLRRNEPVRPFIFPLLMLLWVNLHGGFIFGFLALTAYFAGWLWDKLRSQTTNDMGRKYLLIGLTSLGASVITPDLWRNWEAVLNNRSAFILSRTAETMPPNFADPSITPFIILLTLAVIFALLNRRNISAAHVFLLGGLGAMSLLMTRNIPLFAIASAPILAEWISAKTNEFTSWKKIDARFTSSSTPSKSALFPTIIIALAVVFISYRHSEGKEIHQFNPQVFPVHAADWLEENPLEGRMFNDFNWGGYLLYRLWPRELVFVDSQSDFYGESLMRDYETIMLAQNDWHSLLDQYQIEWALIPTNSPLADQLKNENDWTVVYEDPVAAIIQQK